MAVGFPDVWKASIIFFELCAACLIILILQSTAETTNVLYTENDNVVLLNKSNFASTIFHKDRAFILEFYNSYCGHCIRFAPTWIAFATDIKDWKSVVAAAVLDCANSDNVNVCQDYNIPAFPTVRHFWTDVSTDDKGVDTPHTNVEDIRHKLIDFLTQNAANKGAPDRWPMLQPSSASSLNELWQSLPSSISSFLLISESSNSYVGREIILDFSGTEARILRVVDRNRALLAQLKSATRIPSSPALLLLRRERTPEILWTASTKDKARAEFRAAVQEALNITLESQQRKGPKPEDQVSTSNRSLGHPQAPPSVVYMVDMENTLHNMLRQEVALKKTLSGDSLAAFKSFLAALTKTFPGRAPVMNFLQNLYTWISKQDQEVNMEDIQKAINDSQRSDSFLPDMRDWMGCKGSEQKFRGYTCGLWTLFHSMTTKAFELYQQGEMVNPQQVLSAIRQYVAQFFGCSECAEHFESMATTMDQETRFANDTVIWLWHAHNRVNLRLKGDATEDPSFPKVQFPPVSLCSDCRELLPSGTQQWKLPNILLFFNRYYLDSISQEGVVPYSGSSRLIRVPETNKSGPAAGWNFRYFSGLDISLCVLLYVFSMILLTMVFVLFRLRRHKVKRKNVSAKV